MIGKKQALQNGGISLKELARMLDTSECTVSKALHNKPKVGKKMRARVLELAGRMGYRPNPLAGAMARNMQKIIVIYPEAWPSYYQNIIKGIFKHAEGLKDYRLKVTPLHYSVFSDSRGCIDALNMASDISDAVILFTGTFPESERRILSECVASMKCPVLLMGGGMIPEADIFCHVMQNSVKCGKMAGNLASLLSPDGMAAVIIGSAKLTDHKQKIEGFRRYLRGTSMDFSGFEESYDRMESAFQATEQIFLKHPETSVIYAGTENISGILEYIEKNELTGKVKVVATGYSTPVLSALKLGTIQFSIDENLFLQGRTGMEVLFQFLAAGTVPPKKIQIDPTVIVKCNTEQYKGMSPFIQGSITHTIG